MRVDLGKEREVPVFNTEKTIGIPTIHIVHILDGSGSMKGGKFKSAKEGMLEEINMLKKEKDINYLLTIVEFDSHDRILTLCYRVNVESVVFENIDFFEPYGNTALNDAVYITLDELLKNNKSNEKTLVKIFTDGAENASKRYNYTHVQTIVSKAKEEGFVITFIGTKYDTELVQKRYKIDASNTLSHDNTSRGMKEAYSIVNTATMMYSKSVVLGNDSNTGFFNNNQK